MEMSFVTLLMLCILVKTKTTLSVGVDQGRFIRRPAFDGYLYSAYSGSEEIVVKSRADCARHCFKNVECSSFFYLDGDQKLCHLHSVVFRTADEAVATPGSSYYELTQENCPHEKGYILYRPVPLCYSYFKQLVSWSTADQECTSSGSHLVYAKTSAVSTHLDNFLNSSSVSRLQHVFIGGKKQNGQWSWLDKTIMTWVNWGSGEPSGPDEDCLAMAYFYHFKWNDIPCTGTTMTYICQIDI